MRLLGKKEMAEITPFDFIYTILLGGILEEALYEEKVSILHILFAIALWGALIYAVEILVQKFNVLKKPLKGEPSELVIAGQLNLKELSKNHIEMEQLRSMLRKKGIFSLKDVEYAVLETDGSISVLQTAESSGMKPEILNITPPPQPSIMMIDEGEIVDKGLKRLGRTKEWLMEELSKKNMHLQDIFYGEWTEQSGLYIKTYE
ncbi:hypothetical protein CVD19_14095 [Bacillus sp. T33-2]|nr:hypothetical protein CVD19_14095 [Bacillus sp. T33-2]